MIKLVLEPISLNNLTLKLLELDFSTDISIKSILNIKRSLKVRHGSLSKYAVLCQIRICKDFLLV